MYEGWDTSLNSYEKRSFFRFVFIYSSVIIVVALFLSYLYYQKSVKQINKEHDVRAHIEIKQCERMKRLLRQDSICVASKVDETIYKSLQKEILLYLFGFTLIVIALSLYLAKLSLRPMIEAKEMMNEFIDSMIHDLNTPIAAAKLNLESLEKNISDTRALKKLNRAVKSIENLQSLEESLRLSITGAALHVRESEFPLCAFLEECAADFALVSFTCKADTRIRVDRVLFRRLVDNLIANAIKYNKNSNPIELRYSEGLLRIIDKGMGIKNVDAVFEKFYREASSMNGLGIGLMIVQKVAQHYAFEIKIDSVYGEGTTVSVDLSKQLVHTSVLDSDVHEKR